MLYVLDVVGMSPGVVVVATEDPAIASDIATRYAAETLRAIVIAEGPAPAALLVPNGDQPEGGRATVFASEHSMPVTSVVSPDGGIETSAPRKRRSRAPKV